MLIDLFLKKNRNRKALDYLEVHLTNHCNLNCACCCHFAPLAEEYFMSKDHFTKDLERLSVLSEGRIRRIRLMGGEPLLHPEIKDFIRIARVSFPKSEIAIHSNGILLSKMGDDFWTACAENGVEIILSYYPVGIDYTLISKLAIIHKVVLKTEIDTKTKLFRNFQMDLSGSQCYRKSWHYCTHANASVNLFEGRLYTCDITAHSIHLAKFFNHRFEYTDKDFIDIYKEKSMKRILKKLNKPHPFCRYCCPNDSNIIEWRVSGKELNEWAKI